MGYGEFQPTPFTACLYRCEDLNDSSGNGFNLSGTNTPTFVLSKFNNGIKFVNASNQYASSTSNLSLTENITISCWVRYINPTGADVTRPLIATNLPVTKRKINMYSFLYLGKIYVTTRIKKYPSTETYAGGAINHTLTSADWIHVATTYDGTTCIIYYNGQSEGKVVQTGSGSGTVNNVMAIGRIVNATGFDSEKADQTMDECIIERRAWSAQEVLQYYNQSMGRIRASII